MGIFNFPLVVLVPTPFNVVAFLCNQMGWKPKAFILFQRFVAKLHHDNNCYIRRQKLPKHLHLQSDQRLVNSVFVIIEMHGLGTAVDDAVERSMQSKKS